jgi:hypothetical protein
MSSPPDRGQKVVAPAGTGSIAAVLVVTIRAVRP